MVTITLKDGTPAFIDAKRLDLSVSKSMQCVYISVTYRGLELKLTGTFERLDRWQVSWHRFDIIRLHNQRRGPKSRLANELGRELRRWMSAQLGGAGYTYDTVADIWEAPLSVWKTALNEIL